ncbi:uncharacterized protein LOC120334961 [Styela clava]
MELWLDENAKMGVEGLSSVGQILSNQSCVEVLRLRNCNLSSDQLQAFKSSLGKTEINQLVLDTDTRHIANHEDIVAVENLLPNVTERLSLDGWKIAEEDKEVLQNQLDEIGSQKLQIDLDGSTKLKSQRKSADATSNVFSKQLPTTTSRAGSPYGSFENTGKIVETSQEVGSPRSKLLLSEKQSDKEVTEQLTKLTLHRSPCDSFENTGKIVRTLQEIGSPRSELPLSGEEAEQSDNEVTEQIAKPTQHTLPQIENVSSRRSGSDILLTWDQVSDSNVLYNIEIFCDDVKLGETHTTKVPQYRMKSPTLGKTYRFRVWARDEWGDIGVKTQSNNVIKVDNIEVAGGYMRLNECKVTFPSGTFNKQTKVWMSVGIDNSLCPEEYIGITPVLDISADSEFLEDVIVQMQSWCVGQEKDKIDILHFSSKTDWDIIKPDRIADDNSIEFRCREFSPVLAAIKRSLFGTVELLMERRLYISNKNQFHFAFFPYGETAHNTVRHYYRDMGAQLAPLHLPRILLRMGDRVHMKLQIDPGPENLHFDPPDGHTFLVNKNFLRCGANEYTILLFPVLNEYPQLNIRYEMVKDGYKPEICNRDFDFPVEPMALPQIENVSSRRSKSDILLTWDQVSDSNVLYNIEIFCDDVKLGETHTTEVPQYRMKSPTLGETYRFRVWARDEWGDIGVKTQSSNVIKVDNIEVAGGYMRLNECKVTFPSGTFNKQTKVWMSVGIDNSLCPEEYIGITPVLDISADSEFLEDAIVQIQSWCTGLDKDKVDILHFSSKTDWDNINPDRITEDNSIEFRCRKFSGVMAAIRWLIFGTQELLMEHRLYILNKNQFYFTFFTCCETVRSHVISYFQELRGQLAPIPLPQVLLRTGDRVRINLQIDPEQEDLHFNYLNGYTFQVDKTFLGKQRNDYMFRLLPELEEYPRSKIRYEMIKYGNDQEICDRDFDFPLEPVDHQPVIYNFFGDLEQVHIMGRGNVHTSQQGLQQGQNQLLFTIAVLLLLVAIFLAFLVGWPDSTM